MDFSFREFRSIDRERMAGNSHSRPRKGPASTYTSIFSDFPWREFVELSWIEPRCGGKEAIPSKCSCFQTAHAKTCSSLPSRNYQALVSSLYRISFNSEVTGRQHSQVAQSTSLAVDRQEFEFHLGCSPAVSPLACEGLNSFNYRMELRKVPGDGVELDMRWMCAERFARCLIQSEHSRTLTCYY